MVFFVDADDTVDGDFFSRPMAALESVGADFCIFQYAQAPLKRDYNLCGNVAVREALLPAFIGYSFDDVRRWNAGGPLTARREPGSVCRAVFRRDFIERHAIRFDENLFIYEDAPFFAECALYADRVVSLRENLYNYLPNPGGITATVTGSRRHWDYKFAVFERRRRLAEIGGDDVWRCCEASCVFSALEMLALWRKAGLSFGEFRRGLGEYLAKPDVAEAIRGFPISIRHPAAAAAVLALRRFLV